MKKFSISLVTLIMAISLAAFTTTKNSPAKKIFNNFYRYTPLYAYPDPTDPEQYKWTPSVTCCEVGTDEICIISSPGPSGPDEHPTFTKGLNPFDNTEENVYVEAERAIPQ